MDIRRQVGLNVQRLRRALELSQEALAFEAGIHRTYISGVERGVRNITVTVVERLAAALHVLPHQLLEPLPKTSRGAAREPQLAHKAKGTARKASRGRPGERPKP